MVPRVFGRSYAIEAELEVPEGGAEGVIVANADFIGGSPYGWTTAAGCITPTRSWAWKPTSRSPPRPSPLVQVTFDLTPATHEDERALHEHALPHGIGERAAG
jgi:hypothetical protein